MSIRYLIVDDEAPSRTNLRLAMDAHPGWTLAGECASAAAARDWLAGPDADAQLDVIFLDVQMPVESGVQLARDISRLPQPPLIVFVTAYSEHAIDAFEVHALDYLLKPVGDARLAQALERCAAMLRQRQREAYGVAVRDYADADAGAGVKTYVKRVNVRSVGRIEQVCVDDILWIEAAGNYVELHLAARTVLHRITLNRLEALLDPAHFLRVHRGAIVRRVQIGTLETVGDGCYRLRLRCGGTVAVSERHLAALRAALKAAM
jgi:two-component system LytT family response regulator